jgi:hypothetical protein
MKDSKLYLVYRHRRLDTNKIFYVGISDNMRRPYEKGKRRSEFWNKIVSKATYKVELIFKDITFEEAKDLEMLLIEEYGRKDLNTGSLVNMTNGGEGTCGVIISEETRTKLRKSKRGVNHPLFGTHPTEETLIKLSKSSCRGNNPLAKIVLCINTGIFYTCVRDAAEAYSINYSNLRCYLNGSCKNKTSLIYA